MIKYLRLLLIPFSVLYGIVILIRNKLYDIGMLKSTVFDVPVISVGNLTVGGSGKTPVTEYLVSLLIGYRVAILSRGYGRKTKGYIKADQTSTAQTLGDEPMQFFNKFQNVTVAVCEDRVKGINQLKADHDVIILDDAFQHRAVRSGFSILLFEYAKLLNHQFLLPAGNLREPFIGYKRADTLLITKAPKNISKRQESKCAGKFNIASHQSLMFSFLTYGNLIHLITSETKACTTIMNSTEIFLLTGIANPQPLVSHLKQYSPNVHHYEYPDHYFFCKKDVEEFVKAFHRHPSEDKVIITTEKDAQRLLDETLKEFLLNLPGYYLPIKITIQEKDKATFDHKILNYVSGTTRNR